MEEGSDDLHGVAGMRPSRLRRRLLVVALLVVLVLGAGLASNELSRPRCVSATREYVSETARDLWFRHSRQGAGEAAITWLDREELVDGSIALPDGRGWGEPPLLLPSENGPLPYPWAYAVVVRWPVPFVTRVAHGFAAGGQAGGTGIDYYLTAFGLCTRIRRRPLSAF